MRLREIKLAGFKSFVDPTTVTFPGNRAVVVGPNGCGKSNIIDAVRWVLGESSARQLRGEAGTDVIFNGSGSRQPTSLASIELIFDNRDGRVGGEFAKGRFAAYSEIAIRREVDRESHSTYYLNNTRCRRRDVADVFLGTGFGPRSYSIIEQGMVSQLVEAKPDELRAYLEEAAGVSKYRERRRETQNRIKHTVENLDRLTDLTDELDRQLAQLKRQARAAERYRALKEDERQRRAELHALRLRTVGAALADKETEVGELELGHEQALAVRQAIDTAIGEQRAAHAELTDSQGELQGRFYAIGSEVSKLEQSIAHDSQRLAQLREDLAYHESRRREIKDQLDGDAARIESLNAQLAAAAPALASAEATDGKASADLVEIEERTRRQQRVWEDHAARAADNDRETQITQSRIEDREHVVQSLRARAGALDSEPGAAVDAGIERLAHQIEESTRLLDALRTDLASNGEALDEARERAELVERARDAARDESQRLRRELAALTAVQEAAVGKPDGEDDVSRWLDANGLADAERLGERLGVSPGWELAVETVLGAVVDAIPVPDTAGFAATLADLERGRVTLFEPIAAGGSDAGRLPLLSAYVATAVGSLLDGVYAASSIEEALVHREGLGRGESIVTCDGVWLGTDWIRIDKGAAREEGFVRRAQELERLQAAVERAESESAARSRQLEAVRDEVGILTQERETLQDRQASYAAEVSRATREHDVRQVRVEEADARARSNAAQREEIDAQIRDASNELAHYRERLAELLNAAEGLRETGDELRAARELQSAEYDAARRRAQEARDALHALRLECQGSRASLAAAETARHRLLGQSGDLDKRTGEATAAIAAIDKAVPETRKTLQARLTDHRALEGELADLQRRVESVEADLSESTGKRNEAEMTVDGLRNRLEEARRDRERLMVNRDNVREQLAGTGIDLADAEAGLTPDATEDGWQRTLDRLAAQIARLEPVNLTAIGEYETQSERKQYLDAQREDLETALETLRNAIRRIDRDTRKRFKDTFDAVNDQLKLLFPRFFGGGHAYLVHTGDDWLDTGITLMARPPGKRNSTIYQLSGGEKAMTAVALIFSIFQLNPSPVCLLDEVDAPLDDANADRFVDLIREMSNDVQFVVITHNKQTIEMADHLLGVTMQEPGVSRLVSVDMERAVRLAAV